MILSLGTGQLGVRHGYGVNNSHGELTDTEAEDLLDAARRAGFTMLDTSPQYGSAMKRISKYLTGHPGAFDVMVRGEPGYVSVYTPEEALDATEAEIIQLPANILDGRMDAVIPKLKKRGQVVFVRSLFLQGLLAMDPTGTLAGNIGNGSFISSARPYLAGLKAIADDNGLTVMEMAVRWAWHLAPDVAIFGAESPAQVAVIGEYIRRGELPLAVLAAVLELRTEIPDIVISPRLWGQSYDFTTSVAG